MLQPPTHAPAPPLGPACLHTPRPVAIATRRHTHSAGPFTQRGARELPTCSPSWAGEGPPRGGRVAGLALSPRRRHRASSRAGRAYSGPGTRARPLLPRRRPGRCVPGQLGPPRARPPAGVRGGPPVAHPRTHLPGAGRSRRSTAAAAALPHLPGRPPPPSPGRPAVPAVPAGRRRRLVGTRRPRGPGAARAAAAEQETSGPGRRRRRRLLRAAGSGSAAGRGPAQRGAEATPGARRGGAHPARPRGRPPPRTLTQAAAPRARGPWPRGLPGRASCRYQAVTLLQAERLFLLSLGLGHQGLECLDTHALGHARQEGQEGRRQNLGEPRNLLSCCLPSPAKREEW